MQIEFSTVYNFDNEFNKVMAILSFDIEYFTEQSVIKFFNLTFDPNSTTIISAIDETKTLSIRNLNIDMFRVTALQIMPSNTLLIIGILDYGILIYDLVTQETLNFISIVQYTNFKSFKITSIACEVWGSL